MQINIAKISILAKVVQVHNSKSGSLNIERANRTANLRLWHDVLKQIHKTNLHYQLSLTFIEEHFFVVHFCECV